LAGRKDWSQLPGKEEIVIIEKHPPGHLRCAINIGADAMITPSGNSEKAVELPQAGAGTRVETEGGEGDSPVRILVVDDEEVVCRFLQSLLSRAGYQAEICLGGQEAMAKLEENSFDLVMTDLRMPGVDGLDVLRKAKELDPFCEVIVITAFASVESAVEVMKFGAYDYISKPFNIDEIRIVVEKALEKRTLLRAAEERDFYKQLSRIDGLTEVYNYRAFYELLHAEVARSKRHDSPLSVLMIDLDDLKAYNDTLGHQAGDTILKEVAWLLKKSLRNCDIVARYGGDEFAVILVETKRRDAIDTASRLGRLVEEISLEQSGIRLHKPLTISIGVASYPTDAQNERELVAKADQALYEAKTAGGNQARAAE
jgi:diguanylate cyclase (GGDEF)-like protein